MSEVAEQGRVVVVTGASRGIGRGVAEHLLNRGYRVAGCARSEMAWEAPGFSYYSLDVTDERAVRSTFSRIEKELGGLYGVAHLAGKGPIMNHSLLVPGATLSKFLRQNVLGAFLVTREAAKLMRRHGTGRIVLTSSVAAKLTWAGDAAYVASKAALERMSQVMAKELATFGITVNVVGPAPVPTDGLAGVAPERLRETINRLPLPRFGTVADVANVVDFFLDPASDAISAQVLYLGGVQNT